MRHLSSENELNVNLPITIARPKFRRNSSDPITFVFEKSSFRDPSPAASESRVLIKMTSHLTSFDVGCWLLYGLSMAGALCSGVIYIFGIISEVLHKSGYTPSQIDLIFGLGTFGQYFGLLPGFLADRVSSRVTLSYGLLATVIGYGLILPLLSNAVCVMSPPEQGLVAIADFAVGRIFQLPASMSGHPAMCSANVISPRSQLSTVLLGVAIIFIAQGGVAVHYATLPLLLRQCDPARRGLVSGTLAAGYGASAVLLSALYGGVFHKPSSGRPYILAFLFAIGMTMAVVICFLLVHFLIFPEPIRDKAKSPKFSPTPQFKIIEEASTTHAAPQKRRLQSLSVEMDSVELSDHYGTIEPGLRQIVRSPKFIMYLLATGIMQGTCAATIGNVSLLREARDKDALSETSEIGPHSSSLWALTKVVRFLSIGNFSGRIGAAFVSQYVSETKYHRFFLFTAMTIAISEFLLLVFPFSDGVFLMALFAIASCLGTNFAIGPAWVMQNLSTTIFATLQAIIMCGVAAGTFSLSMLTGSLYEREGIKQRPPNLQMAEDHHLVCRGPTCFRTVQALEFVANTFTFGLVYFMRKL
eukprot:Protomagalhaensia_wolfi_Nauph_80__3027@NODE_30_length_4647_cov_251_041016_g25_i0_p1_GENE_NODE_30_length_4647_cov_251_041016_g25_i0NODE_30_length_4647_cov_251_041016_g25_i0_p1_ORF_typecomplete_len585_score78_17Nodulinlike/PF06813_13/6_7e18Nodulinlike/PF06813_13/7_1e02Nodulinlike/PF06813_13/1e03MFS_1/PF07690_16/2_9e16MFS_1/PF07690_16/0_015MFS_4/PF06779_14/0_77MFS_4/PF06779_14/0_0044MFS_4/PF06779_14/0_00046_NODE_30_length_4647_cov_251_041016_g25_i0601814